MRSNLAQIDTSNQYFSRKGLHSLLQKHAEDQLIKETSQSIGKLINAENGVLNAIKALESTFLITPGEQGPTSG